MVIPFKSLRFREAGPQVWGINFRRVIRSKNEFAGVTPMPASFGGSGLGQMQMAATLVGLTIPTRTRSLELKPYAVASSTTDRTGAVPFSSDGTGDLGVDLKYGLSRGLTADVTVNTDFAQIEEDLQQINLTRFTLLFPEKRDFFLEGQGIFAFGGTQPLGSWIGRRFGRCADHVLQQADWAGERPDHSGDRRRTRDGQGRSVRHRRAEHRDSPQRVGGRRRHELLGRSPAARHPPPKQRGCHRNRAAARHLR